MISLAMGAFDETSLFFKVIRSRRNIERRNWLIANAEAVAIAYTNYSSAPRSAVQLSPHFANDDLGKESLRTNWDSLDNNPTKDVKPSILKLSRRCTLCGDSTPSQIDHALPQSVFPEFSIMLLNLAPVCEPCNRTKSDLYSVDDRPLFLHPYAHPLTDEPWLQCRIFLEHGEVVAAYSVVRSPSMSAEDFEVLSSHFSHLRLDERYGANAIGALAEHRLAIEEWSRSGGPLAVENYLRQQHRSVEAELGRNHWKVALMESLASSVWFCTVGYVYVAGADDLVL